MFDFVVNGSVLRGTDVHIGLSASEILRLADRIITKSKEVHDAVSSVPLDKVWVSNFHSIAFSSN